MWMNAWDIDSAVYRYSADTVRGKAARFLAAFAEETNNHSDGWHSWPLPGRAAEKLQNLIQSSDLATDAAFRKAVTPIKSFYTRHGYKAGMSFPEGFGV